MHQPDDRQLRRWTRWAWGLILVLPPTLFVVVNSFNSYIAASSGIADVVSAEDAGRPTLIVICTVISAALLSLSLRMGMRLAPHRSRALWWVVPQMALLLGLLGLASVWALAILLGTLFSSPQVMYCGGVVGSPAAVIGALAVTGRWTTSVLCGAETGQTTLKNGPSDKLLRLWTLWSWKLIVSSLIVPPFVLYAMTSVLRIVYPSPENVAWEWEAAIGATGILIALTLQLTSLRVGMQLGRYAPRALWWVVPQMVFVFTLAGVLTVCALGALLGYIPTALQLLAVIALSTPLILIGVIGFTIWWTRSALRSAQASAVDLEMTQKGRFT